MDINQSTGLWFYTYFGHFFLHLNKNFIIMHGNQYVSSFCFSSVNKKDHKELVWLFLWEMVNEVAWFEGMIYIFNSEFKSKSSCSEQLNSPEDFPYFWAAEQREIPMASSTVWLSCSRTEPFYSQVCKSWVLCNHSIFNSGLCLELLILHFLPWAMGEKGTAQNPNLVFSSRCQSCTDWNYKRHKCPLSALWCQLLNTLL